MATLYEISKTIEDVIENGFHVDEETGEVFDQGDLDQLPMDFEEKLENVACYVKNLDAEAAAIKAEEKNLEYRRKAKERRSERLKGYMHSCMGMAGVDRLETPKCRLSFRKSSSVNVYQESEVPAEFFNEKTVRTIDKTRVKTAIKGGAVIPGVNVIESLNLQVK